jgi:superfamily II DNA/RNA helicase
MLDRLNKPAGHPEAVDLLVASNMISVGMDIPRLGLMIVNAQPKTLAEYIQATSRVGRGEVPGVVITMYNSMRARDRRVLKTRGCTPFWSRLCGTPFLGWIADPFLMTCGVQTLSESRG